MATPPLAPPPHLELTPPTMATPPSPGADLPDKAVVGPAVEAVVPEQVSRLRVEVGVGRDRRG